MPALLLALLLAFCVDLLFAELPNKLHPVLLMGHFIRSLSQKWNHGSPKRRFWLGFLLTFLGMIVFALPFVPLLVFGSRLPWWLLGVLSGLLLKPTFALRALIKAGMEPKRGQFRQSAATGGLAFGRRTGSSGGG